MPTTQRMNGKAFNFKLGDLDLRADKFTLEITDNSAVASKSGRPDGWLEGDVSASGEITLDRIEFKKVSEAAKKAGSWQGLEPIDLVSTAIIGDDSHKVEAFGCKLKLSSILDVDKTSTDKTAYAIPYDVTGADFIRIDGVPYCRPENAQKK